MQTLFLQKIALLICSKLAENNGGMILFSVLIRLFFAQLSNRPLKM